MSSNLGVLEALSVAPELIEVLERVLGGEVFCWADNKGRLRLMLSGEKSMQVADGPKFSFTTPPHQDYYFFRPVEFCTVWIPLMDIDASIGGLAIERDSHKEGLHEVWWKGKDYLGVAENPEQARDLAGRRRCRRCRYDKAEGYRIASGFDPITSSEMSLFSIH